MTDRELIELAAKAGRYIVHGWAGDTCYVIDPESIEEHYDPFPWAPTDSGDQALELAERCGMNVYFTYKLVCVGCVAVSWSGHDITAEKAITRAAAEIGKAL